MDPNWQTETSEQLECYVNCFPNYQRYVVLYGFDLILFYLIFFHFASVLRRQQTKIKRKKNHKSTKLYGNTVEKSTKIFNFSSGENKTMNFIFQFSLYKTRSTSIPNPKIHSINHNKWNQQGVIATKCIAIYFNWFSFPFLTTMINSVNWKKRFYFCFIATIY